MPRKIILSEADKLVLTAMKVIMKGLSAYLGDGCEIVLHSLENPHSSAIEVINGHHSNRSIGAPITDLALEMLENIEKSGQKKPLTYFTQVSSGATVKCVTIPILGENERIIGLMCVNFYMDLNMRDFLSVFMPDPYEDPEHPFLIETFTQNVDDLIIDSVKTIQSEIMLDENISLVNKNKEIITRLEEKGIFNIKDSVLKIAEILGISKNTVYLHLRNLRKE
jgi:predicted transcriptional regulator YheO